MGEVIKLNFKDTKEYSGYIIDDKGKIKGVYNSDLVARYNGDTCHIGYRAIDGINYPVEISLKDLNQFCIMWLAIFDPEVLNVDESDNG